MEYFSLSRSGSPDFSRSMSLSAPPDSGRSLWKKLLALPPIPHSMLKVEPRESRSMPRSGRNPLRDSRVEPSKRPLPPYIQTMRPTTLIATALGALLLAHPLAAQGPTTRPKVTPQPSAPSTPPTQTAKPPAPAPRTAVPPKGAASANTPGAVTTAYLQGVAVDSIHGQPLVGAAIQLEGTDRL